MLSTIANLLGKSLDEELPWQERPIDLDAQGQQPSLDGSGRDILLLIFAFVHDTSPRSTKALALVCRDFHHLAVYIQSRHLVLHLDPANLQASNERLQRSERHELLSASSRLTLKHSPSFQLSQPHRVSSPLDIEEYKNIIVLISKWIPIMTGLKDLTWDVDPKLQYPIPESILQALHSRPTTRLHVKTSWNRAHPEDTTAENELRKLQESPNLYALNFDSTYHGYEECARMTQPLKRLLLASRGIRSLTLNIDVVRGGCTRSSMPTQYCGLGFVGDESLPPLEELVLSNYPWSRVPLPLPSQFFSPAQVQHLSMQRLQPGNPYITCSEQDHWAENFDWSSLQRLSTGYANLAVKIMPQLTSLREVNFQYYPHYGNVAKFMQECPAVLEAISATNLTGVSLEGIVRHGSELRRLSLHNTNESSVWAEEAMDETSLRAIRDACPLIEELALDIPRDGDWPWKTLGVLGSFPRLRDLTMYFELGTDHSTGPVKPYVTFSAVGEIFRHLRSCTPSGQNSPIARLHVYSGCLRTIQTRRFSLGVHWRTSNSTEFICTLSERDDDAANGRFEIECPRIPRANPKRAKSTIQQFFATQQEVAMDSMRERYFDQASRVALEGPSKGM